MGDGQDLMRVEGVVWWIAGSRGGVQSRKVEREAKGACSEL